ncbi:restriction endonuclease subunit S [Clostridium sp. AM49-4BH]|uniref:restriction endonuclease subunit S n=1 Tax=Clostridium sp. AM49-4BH TaxID=2293035 RepID=UPI000E48162F|nr:restriction endonuclease subunit S [Clostridium sp. AM49-4BH]RHQ09463.1 restriction endonuclease subunit S [Clostridium sp. AM49-4BH]
MMDMFVDTWEQRKFSEFTWNAGKRNKEDLDLEPYAITNEHGFIKQSEAHDDFGYMKDTDRKAYNIVMPNSFAYNPARINVGSIGYYEGTENVIVSSLYEVFQTADYVDDRFLWHWFKSDEFPKWIERLQEGSVRLYFYYDKLCECQMLMPSVPEQKKIAEALDNLDNLITLHQRKLEHVKKMKKSMLQKMFPKKNQLYPEVRFPGFTDAWEQRKFSELVTIERGGSPRPIDKFITNDENGLNWVKIGDAPEQGNYITQTAEKIRAEGLSKTREVHPGDLILSNSMSFGRPYIMAIDGCIHDGWLAIRNTQKNFDLKFLCTLLGTDGMLNQYKAMAAGSTVNNLNKELVGGTTIAFPIMEEQIKIGEYFSNIDHLITLHQRKQNGRNLK